VGVPVFLVLTVPITKGRKVNSLICNLLRYTKLQVKAAEGWPALPSAYPGIAT
jgi:hypothetical protein